MSKSKVARKERYETFTMEFATPVHIDSVSLDQFGNIELISNGTEMEPLTMHFEKGFHGERKDKKTVCIETKKKNICMYSSLGEYDYLIALDTNTDGSNSFSVGLIYRIYRDSLDETKIYLEHLSGIFRTFDNRITEGDSSELVALYELILFFQSENIIPDFNDRRILFIVDHNLDRLDEYNSRKSPLLNRIPGSLLPSNVQLMYASADKKNDSIFNQIVSNCDKEANQLKNPELRKKVLSQVNFLATNRFLIDASKYTIVTSGYATNNEKQCAVELRYKNAAESIDIMISLMFRNDEGVMRTNARFFNLKAYLLCMNFRGLVGLGLAEPLEIGLLNEKRYYLKCWISDADTDLDLKKVDYVIYADK